MNTNFNKYQNLNLDELLTFPSVLNKMEKYASEKHIAFHMPGHKRNMTLASNESCFNYLNQLRADIDLSEIDGMDDLHQPVEMLAVSEAIASKLWQSDHSFLQINGSTGAILASIRSCCKNNDHILIARNCHRSVYHAAEICNLNLHFIPNSSTIEDSFFADIKAYNLQKAFEKAQKNNIKFSLVVITSPNYEGIISDIKTLSKICHDNNTPILVDEAHGAHLIFTRLAQYSACNCDADLVVHSLHKCLPAHTSTAILHCKGCYINYQNLRHQMKIFQTSSPNYLMMASIDSCLRAMANKKLIQDLVNENYYICQNLRKNLRKLQHLKCFDPKLNIKDNNFIAYDYNKFVISCKNTDINGSDLANLLRKYNIEIEMQNANYVLCMSSFMNKKEDYDMLKNALFQIDYKLNQYNKKHNISIEENNFEILNLINDDASNKYIYTLNEACEMAHIDSTFTQAVGKINAEFIWAYPPGIPILLPGQIITNNHIHYLKQLLNKKINLQPACLKNEIISILNNNNT